MPSPAPNPPDRLFRDAVMQGQRVSALGDILLTPRASVPWLVLGAALIGTMIVLFLFFGTYTRRATVTGQLLPSAGVIRVQTPQAGVVMSKQVAEGQSVRKGDVLYILSSDRPGAGPQQLQADISQQVADRRTSLQAEIERSRSVEAAEIGHLERRAATLRAETQAILRQIEQQALRLRLAQEARTRYQGLADQDYIAREQLFLKEAELSDQQSRQQALQRELLVARRDLDATVQDISNTRVRFTNQNALMQRGISSTQQELAEVESRRRVVITAPEAGRATLVVAEVGQAVDASKPLLNLVPENSRLEARLYAPSATIGFVRPGNLVQLRYQSFPYQKFGQHEGRVQSVSNNAVSSSELAGFASADIPPGEPVYAITVALTQQAVTAYGKPWPLQAGMRLDADVLQETRRLYEWVLEPLYSITGKF